MVFGEYGKVSALGGGSGDILRGFLVVKFKLKGLGRK